MDCKILQDFGLYLQLNFKALKIGYEKFLNVTFQIAPNG